MNKIFLFLFLLACCLFLTSWFFNNIDAWIGIIFGILSLVAAANAFIKLFINNKKEDKK